LKTTLFTVDLAKFVIGDVFDLHAIFRRRRFIFAVNAFRPTCLLACMHVPKIGGRQLNMPAT
jgi:hypothetical protein